MFFRAHVERIVPESAISPDLHAGAAYAKGLEEYRLAVYRDGASHESALLTGVEALMQEWGNYEPPEGHPKTLPHMIGALIYHTEEAWPVSLDTLKPWRHSNGEPAVEFSFALPIPNTSHPQTGDPILYAGRFDMLGELPDGTIVGLDDKTTKRLGGYWNQQWDLKSQFTGYTWAARESGIPLAQFYVRGISILTGHTCPNSSRPRKDLPYDHAQAIIYRSPWFIDRWLAQLQRDVARMINAWEERYFDYNLDDACSSYGGCQYKPLCSALDPTPWLADYVHRIWDPTAKNPSKEDNS
jgi:hypothetical protein